MKSVILTLLAILCLFSAEAQEFNKYLANARTSYSAKKLDEARFAMQQMLHELDVIVAKDVLKLLPAKLDTLNANVANDQVSGNSGFTGIMIERDYGTGSKTAELQIIGNSPLTASVNAILSLPLIGGNRKIIKLEGYKALIEKTTDTETNKVSYEIQLPLNSSLLTLKTSGISDDEIQKLVASIPVARLARLLQ